MSSEIRLVFGSTRAMQNQTFIKGGKSVTGIVTAPPNAKR